MTSKQKRCFQHHKTTKKHHCPLHSLLLLYFTSLLCHSFTPSFSLYSLSSLWERVHVETSAGVSSSLVLDVFLHSLSSSITIKNHSITHFFINLVTCRVSRGKREREERVENDTTLYSSQPFESESEPSPSCTFVVGRSERKGATFNFATSWTISSSFLSSASFSRARRGSGCGERERLCEMAGEKGDTNW